MTSSDIDITLPRPLTRLIAGVVCSLAGATSLFLIGGAIIASDQPYYMLVLMELAALVACATGMGYARGAFPVGPGMALLCVAGGIGVPAILAHVATPDGVILGGRAMPVKIFLFVRMGIALILLACASYEVLRRHPRSRWYLLRALMTGLPLLVLLVLAKKFGGMLLGGVGNVTGAFDPSLSPAATGNGSSIPAWILWVLAFVLAVVALVLACSCAHCCIRAFEMGRTGQTRSQAGGSGARC
jgi:hypothetical protein